MIIPACSSLARRLAIARRYGREAFGRVLWRSRIHGIERRCPILVYQMGKVGSSTVVRTLHAAGMPNPVLHVHTLTHAGLDRAVRRQRTSRRPYLPEHLIVSGIMIEKLERLSFPCRIVTLTREPVGRAISFVFEDHAKQLPADFATSRDGSVVCRVLDDLLIGDNGIANPGLWFDQELKSRFGIDVFSAPYDFDRGFSLIRRGDIEVLVIRMEDLDRSLDVALGELLRCDPRRIRVASANEGSAKWYADAMKVVRNTYHIGTATAERVYSTKYFMHFYATDAERLRKRWGS